MYWQACYLCCLRNHLPNSFACIIKITFSLHRLAHVWSSFLVDSPPSSSITPGFKPTVSQILPIADRLPPSGLPSRTDDSVRTVCANRFFGRPFVKRFALCYPTVVCLSLCPVLSCLSVTLVYCGQTVGWIKVKLSMQVGLGPGHIVLDRDPARLPKGTQLPTRTGHSNPLFSAHVYCGHSRPSQLLLSSYLVLFLYISASVFPRSSFRYLPVSFSTPTKRLVPGPTVSQKLWHMWTEFDIFGRNVTDEISNQKTLYYVTSSNLCFYTTWQNLENENCIFTCCTCALSEFNQLLYFFNLFDSRPILTLLCESLYLVINAFSSRLLGHGFGEMKSRALQKLDCVACTMHQCAVFWVSYFAR